MWGGNSKGVANNQIYTTGDSIYFDHLEQLFDSVDDDYEKERATYGGTMIRPFFPLMSSLSTPLLNGKGFSTPPLASSSSDLGIAIRCVSPASTRAPSKI